MAGEKSSVSGADLQEAVSEVLLQNSHKADDMD